MTSKAPITETLAAALIMLTPWRKDRILVDPFCGSGTFPIEAAMMAANIAPGMNREFTAEEQYGLRVEVVNSVGQIISMQYPSHYPIAISGIDVSGLYYIRIVTGTGDLYVGKLIVK